MKFSNFSEIEETKKAKIKDIFIINKTENSSNSKKFKRTMQFQTQEKRIKGKKRRNMPEQHNQQSSHSSDLPNIIHWLNFQSLNKPDRGNFLQEEQKGVLSQQSPRAAEFKSRGKMLRTLDFSKNRLSVRSHLQKMMATLVPEGDISRVIDRLIAVEESQVKEKLDNWETFKTFITDQLTIAKQGTQVQGKAFKKSGANNCWQTSYHIRPAQDGIEETKEIIKPQNEERAYISSFPSFDEVAQKQDKNLNPKTFTPQSNDQSQRDLSYTNRQVQQQNFMRQPMNQLTTNQSSRPTRKREGQSRYDQLHRKVHKAFWEQGSSNDDSDSPDEFKQQSESDSSEEQTYSNFYRDQRNDFGQPTPMQNLIDGDTAKSNFSQKTSQKEWISNVKIEVVQKIKKKRNKEKVLRAGPVIHKQAKNQVMPDQYTRRYDKTDAQQDYSREDDSYQPERVVTPTRQNLKLLSSLEKLDAEFIRSQAYKPKAQARRDKERQSKQKRVIMPLQFASREDYANKLTELLFIEAECERLSIEMIAESNIQFKFLERHEICCKLGLKVPKTIHQNIRDNVILSVVIYNEDTCEDYIGTGVIKKVQLIQNSEFLNVVLQIDIIYPLDKNKRQPIPNKIDRYAKSLDFRIRYDSQNIYNQIGQIQRRMNASASQLRTNQRLVQECIWQAIPKSSLYSKNELVIEYQSHGMTPFNPSQKEAIAKACRQRVSLVQGPPGTGKTKVLAGIVANMHLQHPKDQILVATSMNFTADLVAQALYGIGILKNKVCRVYSASREDIFNLKIDELPEWSIIYKMLKDEDELNQYTEKHTTFQEDLIEQLPFEVIDQAAKFQVEYYFGNHAYYKDAFLIKQCDKDGWIPLKIVYNFNKIKKFHSRLSIYDLAQVMNLSTVVEISEIDKFRDGQNIEFFIKKKKLQVKRKYDDFFGYDVETIKQLTWAQFETFMRHKKSFEEQILSNKPIIVTTVGKATTKMMADCKFTRVVMDEATMVKENEAFLATVNAKQIVMVGDQKQLGPTQDFEIEGPTSLFSRLIQANHPFDFLDTQYRMHQSLMEVPNELFYQNRIKCGYQANNEKHFMYSDAPFLFINVPNGQEELKGTSFYNAKEVEVITKLFKFCQRIFAETLQLNEKDQRVPIQKFTKNSIYVITPYNAQKNAIAECFLDDEIDDQVLSIDSSQGREFDLVFVSMVRTRAGNFIQEYNRINVGITRAKHGLVIVGNADALAQDEGWNRLLHKKAQNVVNGLEEAKRWILSEVNKFVKLCKEPISQKESRMKYEQEQLELKNKKLQQISLEEQRRKYEQEQLELKNKKLLQISQEEQRRKYVQKVDLQEIQPLQHENTIFAIWRRFQEKKKQIEEQKQLLKTTLHLPLLNMMSYLHYQNKNELYDWMALNQSIYDELGQSSGGLRKVTADRNSKFFKELQQEFHSSKILMSWQDEQELDKLMKTFKDEKRRCSILTFVLEIFRIDLINWKPAHSAIQYLKEQKLRWSSTITQVIEIYVLDSLSRTMHYVTTQNGHSALDILKGASTACYQFLGVVSSVTKQAIKYTERIIETARQISDVVPYIQNFELCLEKMKRPEILNSSHLIKSELSPNLQSEFNLIALKDEELTNPKLWNEESLCYRYYQQFQKYGEDRKNAIGWLRIAKNGPANESQLKNIESHYGIDIATFK